MSKFMCGVYGIVNLVNNKIYIGSSVEVQDRRRRHLWELNKGIHPNTHLQRAWSRYGSDAFRFEVLELCSAAELLAREAWWMVLLRSRERDNGYNLDGPKWSGLSRSADTRAKISKSSMGRIMNPESVAKSVATRTGMKFTAQACANISASKRGKPNPWVAASNRKRKGESRPPQTEETRHKISRSKTGYKHRPTSINNMADSHRRWWVVTNPSGETWNVKGLSALCQEHNLSSGAMSDVAKGYRCHTKGWKCRRLNEGDHNGE